jgi:hypothetical protein
MVECSPEPIENSEIYPEKNRPYQERSISMMVAAAHDGMIPIHRLSVLMPAIAADQWINLRF